LCPAGHLVATAITVSFLAFTLVGTHKHEMLPTEVIVRG
jgi:hypothetical protein